MRTFLVALCLASFASAGEPIRFPKAAAEVEPAPPPKPAELKTLTAARLYMIDSDVDLLVFASPPGLVKIAKEAGPIRVRGMFADGDGGYETRTYNGKNVVTIEAVKGAVGRVELIVVPVGSAEEKDAIRKTLDVDAGEGPRPPPPNPDPKPASNLRVLFLYENRNTLTQAQADVVFSSLLEKYLDEKCVNKEWRRWDFNAPDPDDLRNAPPGLKTLWENAKKQVKRDRLPVMVITNDTAGGIHDLPSTPEEALTLLKKYGG